MYCSYLPVVIASERVRANARPDDRLREAIQSHTESLDCFVANAPRNGGWGLA